MKNVKSFSLVSVVVVLGLVTGAQTPPPPLLDQADVQAIMDFCMGPTGEKVLQPPEPGMDRALFCGGITAGPASALAGIVRNVQVLELIVQEVAAIKQQVAQIQAEVAALQAQTSSPLQPQIDAINTKLANMAAALQ